MSYYKNLVEGIRKTLEAKYHDVYVDVSDISKDIFVKVSHPKHGNPAFHVLQDDADAAIRDSWVIVLQNDSDRIAEALAQEGYEIDDIYATDHSDDFVVIACSPVAEDGGLVPYVQMPAKRLFDLDDIIKELKNPTS